MLRNFVTSSDLKRYDASIEKYLPAGQVDWGVQLDEAFELVKDQIRARSIDVRLLGTPIDLNRLPTESAKADALTMLTKTADFTGKHVKSFDGFRRLVLTIRQMSGSDGYKFELQGSNEVEIVNTVEPTNWETVATLTPAGAGDSSLLFVKECKVYRIVLTVTAGTPDITFGAYMVETYHERWISWKALELIYAMLSKDSKDIWADKARMAGVNFEASFDTYQFSIDSDGNNLIEKRAEQTDSAKVTFSR